MRLLRIGSGSQWTVLAVCEADGTCALLEFLSEVAEKLADTILSDLREYVPASEAREWTRTKFSEALTNTDGLFEFRWPKGSGPTPRVLWFYDSGKVIVCSHAVNKKGKLKAADIEHAEKARTSYRADRDRGNLTIDDLD